MAATPRAKKAKTTAVAREDRTRPGIVVALIVASLVFAFLVWLMIRPAPPRTREVAKVTTEESGNDRLSRDPSLAPPRPSASAIVLPPDIARAHREESVPLAPPPVDLPPDVTPLAEEFVPGTTEWEEVPFGEVAKTGKRQTLRFLPKRFNVIVPTPIVAFLEVEDLEVKERIALNNPVLRIRALDKPDMSWIEVPMVDDGSGEDERRGDFRYTATFSPSADQQQQLLGRVMLEGVVKMDDGSPRRIPGTLIYTRGPRAKLTGRWEDEKRDGHLFLRAEVEFETPGTFTLNGQLVGPNREPIAYTRTIEQHDTGKAWMTMRVWGKVIHESLVDGPYHVRNVLLTRDMNERGDYDPGETIYEAYVTRPYAAKDFSDVAYTEPAPTKEHVGPDHPSQADKPPPVMKDDQRMSTRGAAPHPDLPVVHDENKK